MSLYRHSFGLLTAALILLNGVLLTGCRMGVPIHVWEPPTLESTVGKKVVVPSLGGATRDPGSDGDNHGAANQSATVLASAIEPESKPEKTIADAIHEQLLTQVPTDFGRQTELVPVDELNQQSPVRLVSAVDHQHSDIALSSLARRQGFDFVLRGELLPDRRPASMRETNPQLSVSWRLLELDSSNASPGQLQPVDKSIRTPRHVGGRPVVVDLQSAIDRYPDLAIAEDSQTALSAALVRDTYRLITPSVRRDRAQLEIAYLLPGSQEMRQGNALAHAGRWPEAQEVWRRVLEKHPWSIAAMHNLAIASAAEQDFSKAKELARKAVRRSPSKLHKQTLVWIEQRQRDYHRAFHLPDPPEGWFFTR